MCLNVNTKYCTYLAWQNQEQFHEHSQFKPYQLWTTKTGGGKMGKKSYFFLDDMGNEGKQKSYQGYPILEMP